MQGVSLRFATTFHHFFRADEMNLMDGRFSTAVLGASYKFYGYAGHAEFGLCIGHKEQEGGFSLPLVMEDYPAGEDYNTAYTYYQAELKVGPRVWWHVYPKFGMVTGYRSRKIGFYDEDLDQDERTELNNWYLGMPVGVTVDLPTSFGTTGIGFFYEFGLSNVMNGEGWDQGGRMNAITFEIHATIRTR